MFPGILNPNITSDFVSNLWFWRRRYFCVLTSHGHSDLLFQARSTIWTNLNCTRPNMLLCKFHQNLPSSFRGDVVFMCWRTDARTHTHRRTHAAPCHKLTWPWPGELKTRTPIFEPNFMKWTRPYPEHGKYPTSDIWLQAMVFRRFFCVRDIA